SVERATLVPFFEDSAELPEDEIRYLSSFDTVLAYLSDPEKIFERNLARLNVGNLIVRPPFPAAGPRTHVGRYLLDTIAPLLNRQPDSHSASKRSIRAKRVRAHECNSEATAGPACLLYLDADEMRHADAFLEAARSEGKPVVALHPGSGSEKKCWPPERFEALAQRLRERPGCAVLLLLGPADERLVTRMTALAEKAGCSIVRNLPLRHLAALLSRCSAYVGNDSGVTHLAAVTGIPTLAIFGPTDPAVWAPQGTHVRVVSRDVECSPCAHEAMRQCRERVCLEGISVEDVARTAAEITK
ncbi:MAG: glycosyltransferase family 9 protein, partial [Candidatus Hydrogenedentota bacterium]